MQVLEFLRLPHVNQLKSLRCSQCREIRMVGHIIVQAIDKMEIVLECLRQHNAKRVWNNTAFCGYADDAVLRLARILLDKITYCSIYRNSSFAPIEHFACVLTRMLVINDPQYVESI